MSAHILLVEDDDDIRQSIHELLVDEGYAVSLAETGSEAFANLKGGLRPDLLLIDYMMPGLTGPELLRACREDPDLTAIPAIVMSGANTPILAAAGVQSYAPKPFDIDVLCGHVRRLLPLPPSPV